MKPDLHNILYYISNNILEKTVPADSTDWNHVQELWQT